MGTLNPLYPYWSGILIGASSGIALMGGVYALPTTLLPVAVVLAVIGLVVTVIWALK